jgi:rubrerythrin
MKTGRDGAPAAGKRPAGRVSREAVRGLRLAITNELEGREFYRMAAAAAGHDGVRQMFTFLMEEEARHHEELLRQIARLSEGKPMRVARRGPDRKAIRKFRGPLLSPELVRDSRKASGAAAVLSLGMTLEKRAIAHFTALRKRFAGDEAASRFFDVLIAWEKEHLIILTRQYESLREMYWEEARSWPI